MSNLTMSDAARSIGMSFMAFRYRALKLDVYQPNPGRKGINRNNENNKEIDLLDILNGLHPNYLTSRLKKRLIKNGLIKEECVNCHVGPFWNNMPLVLQLDHKNGNSRDHRLVNLQLLCPNCHSQTETFSGKSLRKYTDEERRLRANERTKIRRQKQKPN